MDDNIFNLVTLESMIDLSFKMKVDKAHNGQQALQKVVHRLNSPSKCAKHKAYKVVFMDCNMPVMDGLQATTEIRKAEDKACGEHCERMFIAALTAYSTESFKFKCAEAGMDEYLTKPVDIEDLKTVINQKVLFLWYI